MVENMGTLAKISKSQENRVFPHLPVHYLNSKAIFSRKWNNNIY